MMDSKLPSTKTTRAPPPPPPPPPLLLMLKKTTTSFTGNQSRCAGSQCSSAGSTSGCSSGEGSSSEQPERSPKTEVADLLSREAQEITTFKCSQEDYLEVNDHLYRQEASTLRRLRPGRQLCLKERPIDGSGVSLSCQTAAPAAAASMSEFSAFSLRKSLKYQGLRGRSSWSKELSLSGCCCSECCDCCRLCDDIRPLGGPSMVVEPQDAVDPSLQSTPTMVCLPRRCSTTTRPPGNERLQRTSIAPSAKALLSRVQRPQVRRSMPVPPPVVPLYKELALLASKTEPQRSISSPSLAEQSAADDRLASSQSDGLQVVDEEIGRKSTKHYSDNWQHLFHELALASRGRDDGLQSSWDSTRDSTYRRKCGLLGRIKRGLWSARGSSVPADHHQEGRKNLETNEPQDLSGIYDTPEFDGQHQRPALPARRPSEPPPPPPSAQHKGLRAQSRIELLRLGALLTRKPERTRDIPVITRPVEGAAATSTVREGRAKEEDEQGQEKKSKTVKWAIGGPNSKTGKIDEIGSSLDIIKRTHQHCTISDDSVKLDSSADIQDRRRPSKQLGPERLRTCLETIAKGIAQVEDHPTVLSSLRATRHEMGSNHSVACGPNGPAKGFKSWQTVNEVTDKNHNENSIQKTNGRAGSKSQLATSSKQSKPSVTNKLSSSINRFMESSKSNNLESIVTQTRRTLNGGSRQKFDVIWSPGSNKQRKCLTACSQLPAGKAHNGCTDNAGKSKKVTYGVASESGRQATILGADAMEKRRECFKNGDVFIYPATYKNMNECQKCSRDNRICNCNKDDDDADCVGQGNLNQLEGVSGSTDKQTTSQVDKQQSTGQNNTTNVPRTGLSIVDLRHNAIESPKLTSISVPAIQDLGLEATSKPGEDGVSIMDSDAMEKTKTKRDCTANASAAPAVVVSEDSMRERNCAQRMPTVTKESTAIGSASSLKKFDGPPRIHSVNSMQAGTNDESLISKPISPQQMSESQRLVRCKSMTTSENNISRIKKHNFNISVFDINNNELAVVSKENMSPGERGRCGSWSDCEDVKMKKQRAEENSDHDDDERLTCNLTVGESIKITSTSIRIGSNQIQTLSPVGTSIVCTGLNHTSVVPIQTLSTKRKNLAIKLNRQAIHEDDDYIAELMINDNEQLQPQRILLPRTLSITESPAAFLNEEKINDTLEYSPILTSARDYIKNVNTELQVQTGQSTEQAAIMPSIVTTSQVVDEPTLVVTPLKLGPIEDSTTVMPTTSISIHPTELESSKKSIFDGASKDEILEYLEDARERVPEILMAADDVMVINENELIVVNQLGGADSPATPISIVEANETTDGSGTPDNLDNDTQAHPDQLRQHLAQMYQTSQLANAHLSSSVEDGPGTSHEQLCCSESITSSDLIESNNHGAILRQRGELKGFSRATGETLESIEDQVNSIDSVDSQKSEDLNKETNLNRGMTSTDAPNRSSLRRNLQTTESSISYASNTSDPSNSLGIMHYNHPGSIFDGRRKSEDSSNQAERKSTLQLIMLQQRYSNHDSLSYSSSSPPSSASPASSTSSNQTSGNCSGASTFYASSSLSCSSPFLDLGSRVGFGSPASIQGPTVQNAASLIKDIEYDNQLLESLIRGVKSEDSSEIVELISPQVERDDSGFGQDYLNNNKTLHHSNNLNSELSNSYKNAPDQSRDISFITHCLIKTDSDKIGKLSVIEETTKSSNSEASLSDNNCLAIVTSDAKTKKDQQVQKVPTYTTNIVSRANYGHYATMNKLNNYFVNRHPPLNATDATFDFQCLDCDQFIDVDRAKMLNKTTQLRMLNQPDWGVLANNQERIIKDKPLSPDQLDRAYIAAMNGLPLCKSCEKKRIERKEIISEFVETELKYGRDLKIIHDEFYRPMQIAGLLSKDQINGVFLNLEELIVAHCKFADRLEIAIREAHSMGDTDYNTVNIGRLFFDSAEMLNTFESYCIRQGSAACLLARLAKEKELLRIFLRVSQMENTLLRRMNLAAFLMVPVQRVTKYPLLLNRLYKVTAYHHKDREALRDAQLKVELHLEHINQQTKGIGATNKIWRRISNLSAPIANRRGLMNAEDIGQIKLRKTAMDLLKWDRDETQFIHSGKLNFAPLNEFLIKQKLKSLRFMTAHALLVVLGKPNWKYRLDLVKSNLDSKLMTPTLGGNGVKEAALLLFREKNGRFVPCREPLLLSNCVLSNDCSKYNSECPLNQPSHNSKGSTTICQNNSATNGPSNRKSSPWLIDSKESFERKHNIVELISSTHSTTLDQVGNVSRCPSNKNEFDSTDQRSNSINGDATSMSSTKSSIDESTGRSCSPPIYSSRSCSLASALPSTAIISANSTLNIPKSTNVPTNQNILNQLKTKVNNYHKQATNGHKIDTKSSNNHLLSGQTDTGNGCIGSTSNNQNLSEPHNNNASRLSSNSSISGNSMASNTVEHQHQHYSHHFYHNHNQPYGDYEELFEIHERLSKESMLLRADTPLKTRYWLQLLRYHAKDLGNWRQRRNGLANIMMMRQD